MDKMSMESVDLTQKNIEKIYELFPSVVTEKRGEDGKIKKAVNFELLKQILSGEVVEGDEAYEFTWVGKKEAIAESARPIRKTLRPYKEESKDWDNTENLYLEGDNLDVLKLLQESYLGKVKMIYIDPPYNTGKDFVYRDNFVQDKDEYEQETGIFDDDDNRLFQNTENRGRFHSDWCSMLYPRLMLSRNLLTENGLIFISINDNEIDNLKKICSEIFGENNFVADLIWANKEGGGSSDSKLFRIKHEHILCYAKKINNIEIEGVDISNADRYKSKDDYVSIRGKYYLQKLGMGSIQYSKSLDYLIETPDGTFVSPADNNNGKKACWRWSKEKYKKGKADGFIEIKKDSKGVWTVYTKQYMNCDNEGNIIKRTQRPMGIINEFSSTQASKLLENMNLGGYFNYSKPVELIKYLIERCNLDDGYILDYFSGSATTAQATMQLNAEDGGNRKFIMVQLPEAIDEKNEAFSNGFTNICEIGKERIRRAGDKISNEYKDAEIIDNLDIGFRVFKLDDSNMKDVYYSADQMTQDLLEQLESNIKENRTDLDLLYGCLLEWGLPLSLPYSSEDIGGATIHVVNDGELIACFDSAISEEVVREIAKRRPLRVVFRDGSFENTPAKINVEEIFKLLAPNTRVKVI